MVAMVSPFTTAAQLGGGVLREGARTAIRVYGWAARLGRPPHPDIAALNGDGDVTVVPEASYVECRLNGRTTVTLAYERHGKGDPVVLLHGIGHHRRAWDAVIPLLMAEREIIALDLPGFGQSPDLPPHLPRDLATAVAALGAAFTVLGVERPHVVGHSLGGLIALRLAQAGFARSVTALAPAGFWTESERRHAFAILAAARHGARFLPDAAVARLSRTALGRAALTGTLYARPERCVPEAVVADLRAMRESAAFEATLEAGRVRDLFSGDIPDVPVTIAWGSEDRVLPRHQAKRAKAMIPGARLVELPGCAHVPMNDAPGRVARLILTATDTPGRTSTRTRRAASAT